jgi:PAS domain S-box-containing protein
MSRDPSGAPSASAEAGGTDAEEALRRSEARYRALAEAVRQAVWFLDPATGTGDFGAVQRWWQEATGQNPEEQGGTGWAGWLERVHPEDRERARAAWSTAITQGVSYETEYRVLTGSGETRFVLASAVPVRGPGGEVRDWVGTLRDVTERRRAEQALRESDVRYRWLFEESMDAILIGSLDGKYIDANQAAAEMLGVPLERLIGARSSDFVLPEWWEKGKEIRRILVETGRWEGVFPMRRADGSILWAEYRSRFDGERFFGFARDVTQRRQTEEDLKEAGRRKDEFLAMLAHELRNPLGPIRNAAEILRQIGLASPPLEQAREMIDRQAAHMARLVDDLLDVSRISRGKILLRKEPLDLTALVRAAVEDHRSLLERSGLTLNVELPGEPLPVVGDPTRLSQVVGNLLQNANKFTNPGGRVIVRLSRDPEEDAAVLEVEDTGIGMELDILSRLFQPFSQADRSLDRSHGGLGLGLALVKELAEMHGGRVEASSAGRGVGSSFRVRLPLSRDAGAVVETAPVAPRSSRSFLKILVVEDNLDAAESLAMLLEMAGHQVEVAHTGEGGLSAARRFLPDVALCDIGLPGGMDGYALARALRGSEEIAGAYLIAISGYGQEEDKRQAREAGFDEHLTKPVDPTVLRQRLEELALR